MHKHARLAAKPATSFMALLIAAITFTSCGSSIPSEVEAKVSDLVKTALPTNTQFSVVCPNDLDLSLQTLKAETANPQSCTVTVAPGEDNQIEFEVDITYPRSGNPSEDEFFMNAQARFEPAIEKALGELLSEAGANLTELECPKGTLVHGIFTTKEGESIICNTIYTQNGEEYTQNVEIKSTPNSGVFFQMVQQR